MTAFAIPTSKRQKTVNYETLPRQEVFMRNCDEVPFAAYIGGFGSGKTHTLVLQILREITNGKSFGLVGAPTYRMLADTTMRKFFELCPDQWIIGFSKSENRVTLRNDAQIIFRSLDSPERLTNLELDWFGLDEIGEVKINTFRMLQGRLRRPGGSHHGFGVGNPAGPVHWTYEYFVLKAKDFPDTYRLTQATSYENTFIDQSYTQEMEKSFGVGSLYYRRFVLGEFVAFEGAYWPNFDIRNYPEGHVLQMDQIGKVLGPPAYWKYGRGLDFGYEHPWTMLWWVSDGKTLVFFDEYYARHATIRQHCLKIRDMEQTHQREFGIHSSGVTWSDHDPQCRAEIAAATDESGVSIGFDCSPSQKTVLESIMLVQRLIEQGKLYITERCKHARVEIPSYRAKPLESSSREAPIKEQDDTCDVVRYVAWSEMRAQMEFIRPPRFKPQMPDSIYDVGPRQLEN